MKSRGEKAVSELEAPFRDRSVAVRDAASFFIVKGPAKAARDFFDAWPRLETLLDTLTLRRRSTGIMKRSANCSR